MEQQRPIRVNVLGHGIVEFPAGTSEQDMAAALASLDAPRQPTERPRGTGYRGPTGHDTDVPTDVALSRLRAAAPAIGSIAAGIASGGASIPVQMLAVGAGAAAGQGIKDAPEQMPASDRFSNMALSGLENALLQGAASGVGALAPRLAQGARNLWNRGAKITEPIAKSTQTMRAGGSLKAAKDEIAETVLSQGAGTIKQGNAEALQSTISEIDDAIDAIVSNSKGMVRRQELRDALVARAQSIPKGSQASDVEREALARTFERLNQLPPRMTVAKAQEFKRYIYRQYEKTFVADATSGANAAADKTAAKAARAAIRREEPEVAAMDDRLSKLIPAAKAMDKAVSRASNHNPVSLTQTLAGVVTNPGTVAAALINMPKVSSFTAQQLYNAAIKLPDRARTAANILRMANGLYGMATEKGPK